MKYKFKDNCFYTIRGKNPLGRVIVKYDDSYQLYILQGMPRDETVKKMMLDIPEYCAKYNINENTYPRMMDA